jgi:acetolactate synthase I/II/III large subunit
MNSTGSNLRTGGQILVDQLKIHGVRAAFCVPGESYLAALDALHDAKDTITLLTCRHEGGAANMAEAYGKLTGEPGICFVTRGPGASHSFCGIHTAMQDSTPLILFVGQVAREALDREAFQEVDIKAMFGHTAKWAAQINEPGRIPEFVSRAFHVATSGRPGPVVLGLPEDMLTERSGIGDAGRYQRAQAVVGAADMAALRARLAKAERPFLVVGGGGWTASAAADIRAFAEANNLPTIASFRCQDIVGNDSPVYAGELGTSTAKTLVDQIKASDLLLVVGARLGEISTQGYTLVEIPRPKQYLAHVYAAPDELGRVYQPDMPIVSGMPGFAAAAGAMAPVEHAHRTAWTRDARAAYRQTLESASCPGALDMFEAMRVLKRVLPRDTIMTQDAGNFSGWLQRYWEFPGFRTQLGPTNGSMGYGVPAGVAAKLACPERTVVTFVGDGGFLMTGQELATAVQYGLNVIILVINNGLYGTIRMHQEREYPTRRIATDLRNPDFAALARAYGAEGYTVAKTVELAPAIEAALKAGKPAVLDLKVDPEAITTRTTLSAIRDASLKARAS